MADVPLILYNSCIDGIAAKVFNFETDQLAVALTNKAPIVATDSICDATTAPPPAAANGYPSGGLNLTTVSAITAGEIFTLKLQDNLFQATTGGIGPFRYALLLSKTAGNRLIGYYDYGLNVMLGYLEQFSVDFDDANGVLIINGAP